MQGRHLARAPLKPRRTRRSPWRCGPPTLSPPEVCGPFLATDEATSDDGPGNSRRRRDPDVSGAPRDGQDDTKRQGGDHHHQRRTHHAQEHVGHAPDGQDAGQPSRRPGCRGRRRHHISRRHLREPARGRRQAALQRHPPVHHFRGFPESGGGGRRGAARHVSAHQPQRRGVAPPSRQHVALIQDCVAILQPSRPNGCQLGHKDHRPQNCRQCRLEEHSSHYKGWRDHRGQRAGRWPGPQPARPQERRWTHQDGKGAHWAHPVPAEPPQARRECSAGSRLGEGQD